MSKRLKMAKGWCKTMVRLEKYIRNTRTAWDQDSSAVDGGGLRQYLEWEKAVKEFGEYEDLSLPDSSPEPKEAEDTSQSGRVSLKREHGDSPDKSVRTNSDPELALTSTHGWSAVNNKAAAAKTEPEREAPGVRIGLQYPFTPQTTSLSTQTNPIAAPEAYHMYGPAATSGNQTHAQHHVPVPAGLPAESAQQSSLNSHEDFHKKGPFSAQSGHSQTFRHELRNVSFMANDYHSFSNGSNEQDWQRDTQGWIAEVWHGNDYRFPPYPYSH